MNAHDRATRARARMDQVRREMAERRAMRVRNARAARERAADSMRRQGPVAAQVAKHMGELGRRQAKAGGWATQNTQRDTDYIMGFGGGEDDEPKRVTPPPAAPPPPAPAPVARRVAREVVDDEDDYSNQSWMRGR